MRSWVYPPWNFKYACWLSCSIFLPQVWSINCKLFYTSNHFFTLSHISFTVPLKILNSKHYWLCYQMFFSLIIQFIFLFNSCFCLFVKWWAIRMACCMMSVFCLCVVNFSSNVIPSKTTVLILTKFGSNCAKNLFQHRTVVVITSERKKLKTAYPKACDLKNYGICHVSFSSGPLQKRYDSV